MSLIECCGVIMEQQPTHASGPSVHRNPVYLFACHLEWCTKGKLDAYEELVAALDDPHEDIRRVAEDLLHRSSPRRQAKLLALSGERW